MADAAGECSSPLLSSCADYYSVCTLQGIKCAVTRPCNMFNFKLSCAVLMHACHLPSPGVQELWCSHQHNEAEAGWADAYITQCQPPTPPGSPVAWQHSTPPGTHERSLGRHGSWPYGQPAHCRADRRCGITWFCQGGQFVMLTCVCGCRWCVSVAACVREVIIVITFM